MAGTRGRTIGLVVVSTLLVLPVVAFATVSAVVFWSGCFLECSEPEPGPAVVSGLVAVLFLAVPVAVGVASSRDSRRLTRWTIGVTVALLVLVGVGTSVLGIV